MAVMMVALLVFEMVGEKGALLEPRKVEWLVKRMVVALGLRSADERVAEGVVRLDVLLAVGLAVEMVIELAC